MCFFISFLPATIWIVIGYFVLFSTTKVDGSIQLFGKILAIWVFIIASLFPIAGAYLTISGICPMEHNIEVRLESNN